MHFYLQKPGAKMLRLNCTLEHRRLPIADPSGEMEDQQSILEMIQPGSI